MNSHLINEINIHFSQTYTYEKCRQNASKSRYSALVNIALFTYRMCTYMYAFFLGIKSVCNTYLAVCLCRKEYVFLLRYVCKNNPKNSIHHMQNLAKIAYIRNV